jgi:hypothetical protein
MSYIRALFLLLVIGGCVDTSLKRPSISPATAQQLLGSDFVPDAFDLKRYPLVDLRSDLGEFLIEQDKKREEDLILQCMNAVDELIRLRAKDPSNIGRGDHAKPLGCYPAEFTLSPPDVVRPEDQAGIAKRENLGKTFPAVIRFSNSEPKDVSDFRSATTGIAIEVTLDPAKHSKDDFLFERSGKQVFIAGGFYGFDTFISRNIADYADLFERRVHPFRNALAIANQHPDAFAVFGTEPLLRLLRTSSATPIVLEKQFSSLLPYAWGDSAVKYRFEPCHSFDRTQASFSRFDSGYQAKLITEFLQSNDICYVMKIQARPRPRSENERNLIERTFPVEDAMVYWPEPEGTQDGLHAEFREVARIKIKKRSEAMNDLRCEQWVFNPWTGLKAHQPLGSLNRARLAVYMWSALVRKDLHKSMSEAQR